MPQLPQSTQWESLGAVGQLRHPWRLAGLFQGAAVSAGVVRGCSSGVAAGGAWLLWVLEILGTWDFCTCLGYCVCWDAGAGASVYDRPAPLPTAPEVVKGDPVGSAADVWGVGVLTYIM